jgi:hypothetical protein
MEVNKNLIIAISQEQGSGGGCWYHRIATIANHINASPKYGTKVIETPIPIFDSNLLAQTKCVLIQRPTCPMPWLKNYKELQPKFGYSICSEIDDAWWNIIPEYNMSSLQPRNWDLIDKIFRENLQYIDRMIVTTEFMRRKLNNDYNYWNVRVIENAAPKSLYSANKKTFFRERPLCIIPSGMQHYRPPQPFSQQFPVGVVGLRGDYCGEWPEFLIDEIKSRRLDLHAMADKPYFLSEVHDLIETSPWLDTPNYAAFMTRMQPDIILAPLVENDFNKAKSRLKCAEGFAIGAIVIGNVFPYSPYEVLHPYCKVPANPTKEQLHTVFKNVKEHWKEILEYQYDFINRNGEWLESEDHVNKWLTACSTPNIRLI